MIQELFGAGLLNQDPNNNNNNNNNILPIPGVFEPNSPSPSPSTSTTTTIPTTAAAASTTTATAEPQKLRCPRCDSSNTKFCYYNNYNLTQPRHFCKTCRRYWTKGGALRNVPIGGGCRKNKGTTIAAAAAANGKLKAVVSSELGRPGFLNGFEHEFNPNPGLWPGGPPQTSHLLSLLRNPNPNFSSNPVTHMKDQGFMIGSGNNSTTTLGFEPLGLCTSLWRNNNQQNEGQGMIMTERLRSTYPGSYYHHDQTAPLIFGSNTSSSTSNPQSILDSAPVLASGELGFWNQTLPWSDLAAAATNGAYP